MRITDDRYQQERIRLELGLRLLRHQAKNCTIRQCAGLSEDRVRKLFKTYFEDRTQQPLRRPRGKSPQELSIFLRNGRAHLEASLLAGALWAAGLANRGVIDRHCPDPAIAARCCDAYEYYLQLWDRPQYTFEHAWFLALTLARGVELKLEHCIQCQALLLQDRFAGHDRPCPFCLSKPAARAASHPERARRSAAPELRLTA